MSLKIRILTAGGTIDKIYFDAKSVYEVGPPNVEKVLGELSLSLEWSLTQVMRKDSLEMTDQDREILREAAEQAPEDRIIVTHGTDTMVRTAGYLSRLEGKTIVLTGALEPALFRTSDALFNIGCALAAVQLLPAGVYIAMNGRVFPHDNVVKDLSVNRFVPLLPEES